MVVPGTITEIVGRLSSGRTSLLVACLGEVTGRAGVDLARLLWVRCGGRRDVALRAADLLVRCQGFALVGLDLGETATPLSPAAAFRLRFAVERTAAALVVVGRRRVTGPAASLVVETVRDRLEWAGPGPVPPRPGHVRAHVRALRARPPPP